MASSPVVLVTGGNTGLGLETIRALLASPKTHTILMGSRSLEKANAAIKELQQQNSNTGSTLEAIQVDISSDESIASCVKSVAQKFGKLDVLVNNAGHQLDPQLAAGKLGMREMWNASWDVNVAGTQVITHEFVPLILKSSQKPARIVFITSGTSTLANHVARTIPLDKSPDAGWPKPFVGLGAYRASKTGMNMMVREWARLLENDGVKVLCISPGMLATGLGTDAETNKKNGAIDPAIGGNLVKDVIEGKRDADAGKVILKDGIQPW